MPNLTPRRLRYAIHCQFLISHGRRAKLIETERQAAEREGRWAARKPATLLTLPECTVFDGPHAKADAENLRASLLAKYLDECVVTLVELPARRTIEQPDLIDVPLQLPPPDRKIDKRRWPKVRNWRDTEPPESD